MPDNVPDLSAPKCAIAAAVMADVGRRAKVGLTKYGVTVADASLNRREWLQHMYEELLDAAVYTRRLIELEGGYSG